MSENNEKSADRTDHDDVVSERYYKTYEEYSRTLRTWLVAYGIGGPVIFLTNDTLSAAIVNSGQSRKITFLFLAGVALQVLVSLINKWVNWYKHAESGGDDEKDKVGFKVANYMYDKFWIDVACDAGTIIFFLIGTWMILGIFAQ